jgi:hypothetical protein
MTRKDYEKIANAIAESISSDNHTTIKTSKLISKLERVFIEDNSNFDATRFMDRIVDLYHEQPQAN